MTQGILVIHKKPQPKIFALSPRANPSLFAFATVVPHLMAIGYWLFSHEKNA